MKFNPNPEETAGCRPESYKSFQAMLFSWNHSSAGTQLNGSSSGSGGSSATNASSEPPGNIGHHLLSLETTSCLIVLYVLTILFSVLGNILVVIVFTKGGRSRTDIRPFLINLAVADLIMAIFCMPFTFTYVMTRTWIFTKPMCPIVLFMQHLSVSASVFTNMAIGVDRFLVVTFPLRARMTSKRARYTIGVIWVCAISLSCVQLVIGRANSYRDIVHCDEQWASPDSRRIFTMFVLFITYILPLVILAVTYSIVSILLWKRTAPGNAHEGRDLQQLKGKRKVIKMLVLVVIMFGVCWLPLHTFFLVLDFNPGLTSRTDNKQLFTIVYYVVFWLAMSNSCANPIIYGFTNDSFRKDLASLCFLGFPFCMCLKHVANRRLSVSTMDSINCKKGGGTFRRSLVPPGASRGDRNDYALYIELQREPLGGRKWSAPGSQHHRYSPDGDYRNSSSDETPSRSSSCQWCHRQHGHRQHVYCYRSDSGDTTLALTTPVHHAHSSPAHPLLLPSPPLPSPASTTTSTLDPAPEKLTFVRDNFGHNRTRTPTQIVTNNESMFFKVV